MTQYGVAEPRAMRTAIYSTMMADTQVIRHNRWSHTIDLLRITNEISCNTAVATMSQRTEAIHILRSLELEQTLDLIFTRENVKNPKPDPEIYLMAARKLRVFPEERLVLEDSHAGVRAGVTVCMNVIISIVTPFTITGFHSSQMRPPLDRPGAIGPARRGTGINEHNRTAH